MKLFKRKPKQKTMDLFEVAEALSQLEPKRMERLVEIAKTLRASKRDLYVFVNGRPDEVDKIEREIENGQEGR